MTNQIIKEIRVNTPSGTKFHGAIVKRVDGVFFFREVDWTKDRMRIFDAWSIHPDALVEIVKVQVDGLEYKCGDKTYRISLQTAEKHGFEKEFSGGKTFYIPIKFWNSGSPNTLL